MALDAEHGVFTKQAGTGNQTVTLTDSGLTPKFIMFFGDGYHTADGIVNDYYGPFRGWTSTSESAAWSTSVQSNNKNGQAGLNDGCILILDEDAATEAKATIVSMSSGEFVINWGTNANTTACRIFYVAIGGSDLTDIKIGATALNTSTGNQEFNVTSFTPKIGFFTVVDSLTAFPTDSVGNSGSCLGVALSSSKRWCINHPSKGDRGKAYFDNSKIINNTDSDAVLDAEVDFVSFDNDGFTINIVNQPTTADELVYVLLGGTFTADVGTLTSPLSTGTQQVTTTDQPSLVGLSTNLTLSGDSFGDNHLQVSYGMGTSSTARSNHTYTNPDNKTPESASEDAYVIQGYIANATLTASTEDADIDSFNSTDFTLDWTKVSASNAYQYGWWMLGQGFAGTAFVKITNETMQISEQVLKNRVLVKVIYYLSQPAETLQVIESVIKAIAYGRVINETQQITEYPRPVLVLTRVLNEVQQITEQVVRTLSIVRVLEETVQISETIHSTVSAELLKIINETQQISETIHSTISAALLKIINETAQIGETTLTALGLKRIINETQQLVEAVQRNLSFRRIIDETVNITENILNPRAMKWIINETVQAAEGLLSFTASSITKVINETVEISETIHSAISIQLVKFVNEIVQIGETALTAFQYVKAVNEIANISETIYWKITGPIIKIINETQQIAETIHWQVVSGIVEITKVINETVNVSETIYSSISISLVKIANEVIQITEQVFHHAFLVRAINEIVGLIEGVQKNHIMVRFFNESVQIVEEALKSRTMVRVLNETVNIITWYVGVLAIKRVVNESLQIAEDTNRILVNVIIKIVNETVQASESIIWSVVEVLEEAITSITRRIFHVDKKQRILKVDRKRRKFYVD